MKSVEAPDLKNELMRPIIGGGLIALAVLIALPLTQRLTDIVVVDNSSDQNLAVLKPPVVMDLVIDPPKVEPPKIDKLKVEPDPISIAMMESMMAGVSLDGFTYTDLTLPYGGTDLSDIIDIKDLTRAPHPISQAQPIYPSTLKASKIEGTVVLQFVVREDGSTANIEVLQSSERAFSDSAIKAVRKWTFTPGEKDGRVVKSRVQIKIPFNIK